MKLNINKINDQYFFEIDEFSSLKHFYLSNLVKSTYKTPHESYASALRFMKKGSIHLETLNVYSENLFGKELDITYSNDSAEEIMLNHYVQVINVIKDKSEDNKDLKDDEAEFRDKKKLTYEEIKIVVQELLAIKKMIQEDDIESNDTYIKRVDELIAELKEITNQYYKNFLQKDIEERGGQDEVVGGMEEMDMEMEEMDMGGTEFPQLAMTSEKFNKFAEIDCNNKIGEDALEELLIEYGERACSALNKKHPNCIFKIKRDNSISIYDLKNGEEYLILQVNDYGNLEKIIPGKNNFYSLHSSYFYQKYWKPVVTRIGHIYLEDHKSLIVPSKSILPDHPKVKSKEISESLEVWDTENKEFKVIDISFSNPSDPCWIFKTNIKKKASNESLKGMAFRAIDPELESIFNKVGYLEEYYDFVSGPELAINFGRNIVRLTPQQIERVNV